jgi:hypothetical protein
VPGRVYEVVISDHVDADHIETRLVIFLKGGLSSANSLPRCETPPVLHGLLLETDGVRFPVYCGINEISGDAEFIRASENDATTGTRFCDGRNTTLRIGFNLFEETNYLLTNGQPLQYAHYPTLDIHIDNLRKWILLAGIPLVEIPPAPKGHKFFACLTHDVDFAGIRNHKFDHTMVGFLYRCVATTAR